MNSNYQKLLNINNIKNPKSKIPKLEFMREEIDDVYIKILISNELGISYRDSRNYKSSIENYTKAINYAKSMSVSKDEIGICLLNLAGAYRLNKELERAKQSLDEAKRYIFPKNSFGYGSLLNYYGHYYNDIMNYELAFENYRKSLEYIMKTDNNSMFLANCYNNIANSLRSMKRYEESIEYYEKAKEIYDSGKIKKGGHYFSTILNYIETLNENGDCKNIEVYNEIMNWIAESKINIPQKAREGLEEIGRLLKRI